MRLIDGTEQILDGVTAIAVGGHSPGQQVTVVGSDGGDVVLTSDAVHFYEELELERPFAVVHDLEQMYARLRPAQGARAARARSSSRATTRTSPGASRESRPDEVEAVRIG